MQVSSMNCLVIFKLGNLGEFKFRRIALDPDQITRVESRSYGITHDVVVSWKEPNVETIIVPCETIEEAIKLQDLILQVIHDAKFFRRLQYG